MYSLYFRGMWEKDCRSYEEMVAYIGDDMSPDWVYNHGEDVRVSFKI